MTFTIIPSISVFSPIYANYKQGHEPSYFSSIPNLWEFFYQEKPIGNIELKWTMELWEKIEKKVGTTNKDWLWALFGEPDRIAYDSGSFDHNTSLIELAKTDAIYKNRKVLVICDNDKLDLPEHVNILLETSENFMKIVEFVKNLDGEKTKNIPCTCNETFLELFLFNKSIREKLSV